MSGNFSPEQQAFLDSLRHTREPLRAPGEGSWDYNDSTFEEYFRQVELAGHPEGVLRLIAEHIGYNDGNVGIDYAGGSNAVALRGLMVAGLIGSGVVTNRKDRRSWAVLEDPAIDHVTGNLTSAKTWRRIKERQEELAPEGFALALHRPYGALQELPTEYYIGAVNMALDMMKSGSAIFTQIPAAPLRRAYFDGDRSHLEAICESIAGREDVSEVVSPVLEGPSHQVITPEKAGAVILK